MTPTEIIDGAIAELELSHEGGEWLEELTVRVAPYIREWDMSAAYTWGEWPERESCFPDTTNLDIGIDVVAIRRSDGRHIAIQCKSRHLDKSGRGTDINKNEIDKIVGASADTFWSERWIVTNGNNKLSGAATSMTSLHTKPLRYSTYTRTCLMNAAGST